MIKTTNVISQFSISDKIEDQVIDIDFAEPFLIKKLESKEDGVYFKDLYYYVISNKEVAVTFEFEINYDIVFNETGFRTPNRTILKSALHLYYPFEHVESYQTVNPVFRDYNQNITTSGVKFPIGEKCILAVMIRVKSRLYF